MAWKITSSLSNTQLTFWPNFKAFVQFVFDNKVLTIAAKVKGQAYLKIKEVISFSFSKMTCGMGRRRTTLVGRG
jgi:hypothetical protein